jgi:hypothetical protein
MGKIVEIWVAPPMVMIFDNLKKKVDGFANVVWWLT